MTHLFAARTGDGQLAALPLLTAVAGEVWGLPTLPAVGRHPKGKPHFPQRPDLHFNLSHSGPYALCALSSEEVGVDIECLRPRRPGLAGRALSPEELDWYRTRGERWEDFYTLWTLKEARVKCVGTGLTWPPSTIAVPLLEPGQWGTLDGLTFTAYGHKDYRAALCTRSHGTATLEWRCIHTDIDPSAPKAPGK